MGALTANLLAAGTDPRDFAREAKDGEPGRLHPVRPGDMPGGEKSGRNGSRILRVMRIVPPVVPKARDKGDD